MSSYNITVKDWLIRTWLDIKMNFRYLFHVKKYGNFIIPSGYVRKFTDEFTESDYSKKWEGGGKMWGQPYHPGDLKQWYDDEQIKITSEGCELSAVVKPCYFQEINTTIPNAIGLLRTYESWKYGIFCFTGILPSGNYLWPALWLSGRYNWPPEIDLLEGYTEDSIDYHKNKKLQSNVHFGTNTSSGYGNYMVSGARTHRLPNEVTKNQIEYVIWWEKDFIKLYYNGYLVRHITDKKVLDGMFEEQQVIINNGVSVGFVEDNITPMTIKKIEVYQK